MLNKDIETELDKYTVKRVDPDNPQIVTREFHRQYRRKQIRVGGSPESQDGLLDDRQECPPGLTKNKPSNARYPVYTPRGVFDTLGAAARAYSMSEPSVIYHCTHFTNRGFYYVRPQN
jgi:hypothetical protein